MARFFEENPGSGSTREHLTAAVRENHLKLGPWGVEKMNVTVTPAGICQLFHVCIIASSSARYPSNPL